MVSGPPKSLPPVFSQESLEEVAPPPPVIPPPDPRPPQTTRETNDGEGAPPSATPEPIQERPSSMEQATTLQAPAPWKGDLAQVQNHCKKALAGKPAVAAYLQQARSWTWEAETLVIWFDNKVAFNIVLPELESLKTTLKGLATPVENLEIREWEDVPETVPDLDDFDRQVDLIAQVFRGERLPDKSIGDKK